MATNSENGHSLWFVPVPTGETRTVLDGIIATLAARLDAPVFVPHMTLIPDVVGTQEEVLAHTAAIASKLPSFEVTLKEIAYVTGSLYQGLYVFCTPTPQLSKAVEVARQEFDRTDDNPHKPHISIAYKQETPDEVKDQIKAELETKIAGLKFTVDHIEVWTNGLPIENWQKVGEFPLVSLRTQ